MYADAGDLLALEFFERAEDQAVEGFGIDGEFAAQDAAGDGKREPDQIGFGFGAQAGAEAGDFVDGARQALDDWSASRRRRGAAGGLALAHAGGVGFARALLGLLLRAARARRTSSWRRLAGGGEGSFGGENAAPKHRRHLRMCRRGR